MSLFRLTVKNASRAPVRGLLTVIAVAITLVAFVLLRTLSALDGSDQADAEQPRDHA